MANPEFQHGLLGHAPQQARGGSAGRVSGDREQHHPALDVGQVRRSLRRRVRRTQLERSDERINSCNGYRPHQFDSRVALS